jgi:hypothetical protein
LWWKEDAANNLGVSHHNVIVIAIKRAAVMAARGFEN